MFCIIWEYYCCKKVDKISSGYVFNVQYQRQPSKILYTLPTHIFQTANMFFLLLGLPLKGVDDQLGLIRKYFIRSLIHIAPDTMHPATGENDSMVLTCWISAVVGGPTLTQYWINILRFLIGYQSQLLTGKHWLRLTFTFKLLDFSLTWRCDSLQRSTISSVWKKLLMLNFV